MGQCFEQLSIWLEAQAVLETAREEVADLVGAQPREILFTSGGTESNNPAIRPG